jgi:hypothetical protein
VRERERIYCEHFWNKFAADKTHSIPAATAKLYTAASAETEKPLERCFSREALGNFLRRASSA